MIWDGQPEETLEMQRHHPENQAEKDHMQAKGEPETEGDDVHLGQIQKLFRTEEQTNIIRMQFFSRAYQRENGAHWWGSPSGLQWLKEQGLASSEEFWKEY